MPTTKVTNNVLVDNAALNNLNAGASIAFTKSVSVTGNFTVDTNTFFVDSTNNRVGIGTTSPTAGYSLDVAGAIRSTGNLLLQGNIVYLNSQQALTQGANILTLGASTYFTSLSYGNASTTQHTFNGSGITAATASFTSTTRPTSAGTGAPAATSLMTRDDVSNYTQFARDLFRSVSMNASGAGATVRRSSALNGAFDGDISTSGVNGSYIRTLIANGSLDNYFDGVSVVSFSRRWTLFTKVALNLPTNVQFHLGVGVDATTGIPSSGTNIGFQFTANNSVRLWRCNGGAATYSSDGTISNLPTTYPYTGFHYIWLECVGDGTINLYVAYAAFGSSPMLKPASALCTLTGVGSAASARIISSFLYATGTPASFASCVVGDARFLEF